MCISLWMVMDTVYAMFLWLQNVKAVFDAAIKVVLQPPKQKKKKRKAHKGCSFLWSREDYLYWLLMVLRYHFSYRKLSRFARIIPLMCIVSTDLLLGFPLEESGGLYSAIMDIRIWNQLALCPWRRACLCYSICLDLSCVLFSRFSGI